MANLVFTVPDAALTFLDGYAQSVGFADFRAYTIDWMKRTAKMVRQRQNEQQAQNLVATTPPDVNVT